MRYLKYLRSWINLFPDTAYTNYFGVDKLPLFKNILVNHPTLVARILRTNHKIYPKHRFVYWLLKPLIGDAAFSLSGDDWVASRLGISAAYTAINSHIFLPRVFSACERSISRIAHDAKTNNTVEISQHLNFYTADVIIRSLFGGQVDEDDCRMIGELFIRYQSKAGWCLPLALMGIPTWLLQPFLYSDAHKIRRWLSDLMHDYSPTKNVTDIYSLLQSDSKPDHHILDQTCMFFLAGHETTAIALSFSLYLLGANLSTQEDVFQEISAHCNCQERSQLTTETLDQLLLTKAVFMEALRLYPPLPFLLRETSAETSLAGVRCPVKTMINISPWTIHRHQKIWECPEEFNPHRFLSLQQETPCNFIPFGYGPRTCPGAQFAIYESLTFLVLFLSRWRVKADPQYPPPVSGRLTLRAVNGVPLFLSERNSALTDTDP
ncbi:MAG: cytochrome P450 [Synechococcus sp. WH 8007]|nr:cytochrome P450 [Synechococcus sp. WH 8007]